MIRLLAFDLDGTLLDRQKQIRPSSRMAIRRAADAGAAIALCSGRNHADAVCIASQLSLPCWSITTNGAYLGHTAQPMPLETWPLSAGKAAQVIEISRRFCGCVCIYTPRMEFNDAQYVNIVEAARREGHPTLCNPDKTEHSVADPAQWPAILDQAGTDLMKCVILPPSPDRFQALMHALLPLPGLRITTSVMFSGEVPSIEVNAAGVSKGTALAALQNYLGIPRAETMAFGDSENDLDMLAQAGIAVAMGNALPKIQAHADYVTGTNCANGIADALNAYGF